METQTAAEEQAPFAAPQRLLRPPLVLIGAE